MKINDLRLRLLASIFGLALLLTGCVSNTQYRTSTKIGTYNDKTERSVCPTCSLEEGDGYSLGYVELDDQGWFWNHEQVSAVTNCFSQKLTGDGALILTFIHGWKHNASDGDDNVQMFHGVLRRLAAMEKVLAKRQGTPARQVLGVYVGWRGLTHQIEPFKELTFWGRKTAAEVVGHGAVIELLAELERLRDISNRSYAAQIKAGTRAQTKMVTMGHSFGAEVLYSAAAPILIDRMVKDIDDGGKQQNPKSFGDLIVLVNPAFEAARFQTIHRLSESKEFTTITNCTLAVFTSVDDFATKDIFPFGRGLNVSSAIDSYRDNHQQKANVTALGHYQPWITHDLRLRAPAAQKQEKAAATNEVIQAEMLQKSSDRVVSLTAQLKENTTKKGSQTIDGVYPFTHCDLVTRPTHLHNEPVFVVSVDDKIIADHNAISSGLFIRFLGEFVTAFTSSPSN
ncbi:MAG: putative lipoprotein [Verrucomicrobiales bacterium]|nr:putative lipoprotein [Verrucomicrobiales bacterium]